MNFETIQAEPFDRQLSRLLAIIIMSQKKIESLRKKLAGNEEFHTRLVFNRLDFRKKGEITPEDIVYSMTVHDQTLNLHACQYLCRKYSVSGAISYEELLSLIVPKTDKALAQRMLIRTTKRGASLPDYLWQYFCQMFTSLISMTAITENMRRHIQNCADLNHLQMVQFFRIILRSEQAILNFCNSNSEQEYDFSLSDTRLLKNSVRSGNSLREMTDEDIKELICPLDMNFQKTEHQMAGYYQNIKLEKQKTINGDYFKQINHEQQTRTAANTNFLNSNYRSMYPNTKNMKQNMSNRNVNNGGKVNKFDTVKNNRNIPQSDNYLDKFIKLNESSKGEIQFNQYLNANSGRGQGQVVNYIADNRSGLQIDQFLAAKARENKKFEKFEDQPPEYFDSSVSNSAFVHY